MLKAVGQKSGVPGGFVVTAAKTTYLATGTVLHVALSRFGGDSLGIVLKIETRQAFEHLPQLLLTAMRHPHVAELADGVARAFGHPSGPKVPTSSITPH